MKNILAAILVLCGSVAMAQTSLKNSTNNPLLSEKDTARLNTKIHRLVNSHNENDVSTVIEYYIDIRDIYHYDSLARVAAQRFPRGHYALKVAMDSLSHSGDPVKLEKIFNRIHAQFPGTADTSQEIDLANGNIAVFFAKNKNTAKALMHLSATRSKDRFILSVASALLEYDPKAAVDLLSDKINRLQAEQYNLATRTESSLLYKYEIVYSIALLKLGRPSDSLIQAKDAYDHLRSTADDAAIAYAAALAANNKYEQALPFLQDIVIAGRSNNDIDNLVLTVYGKVSPGKNAAQYLDSLKDVLVTKKMTEVAAKMLDKICPDFTVTDEQGKEVSLTDFKGKTIVLDFWATWCGPCKASFPAMQLVVNRYKKDPNVQFLFIHTWEETKTAQKDASDYLKANHYDLPLYMDLRNPVTKKNPASSNLLIAGLPTKFVIDGNGHIRFRLSGFPLGMDQAHAAEVSAMIELARKSSAIN